LQKLHLERAPEFDTLFLHFRGASEGFSLPLYCIVIVLNLLFPRLQFFGNLQSYELVLCTELTSVLRQCSASQSTRLLSHEQWKIVWCTIEKIYRTVVDCGDIWKDSNKSLGKRRAFSELLKLLESSRLSRHRSIYMEVISIVCLDISFHIHNLDSSHIIV
jgi:hypothetical protein